MAIIARWIEVLAHHLIRQAGLNLASLGRHQLWLVQKLTVTKGSGLWGAHLVRLSSELFPRHAELWTRDNLAHFDATVQVLFDSPDDREPRDLLHLWENLPLHLYYDAVAYSSPLRGFEFVDVLCNAITTIFSAERFSELCCNLARSFVGILHALEPTSTIRFYPEQLLQCLDRIFDVLTLDARRPEVFWSTLLGIPFRWLFGIVFRPECIQRLQVHPSRCALSLVERLLERGGQPPQLFLWPALVHIGQEIGHVDPSLVIKISELLISAAVTTEGSVMLSNHAEGALSTLCDAFPFLIAETFRKVHEQGRTAQNYETIGQLPWENYSQPDDYVINMLGEWLSEEPQKPQADGTANESSLKQVCALYIVGRLPFTQMEPSVIQQFVTKCVEVILVQSRHYVRWGLMRKWRDRAYESGFQLGEQNNGFFPQLLRSFVLRLSPGYSSSSAIGQQPPRVPPITLPELLPKELYYFPTTAVVALLSLLRLHHCRAQLQRLRRQGGAAAASTREVPQPDHLSTLPQLPAATATAVRATAARHRFQ